MIAFRGTADGISWILTDFMAFPIDFLQTGTQVHAGFEWNRLECMKQAILQNVIEEIKKDKSNPLVIISGHSLGAAVAVLETAYFIEQKITNPENIYMVTYAEPCPGTENFVERYKPQIEYYKWFCNLFDPVPLLPVIIGYQHFDFRSGLNLLSVGPKVPPLENTLIRHDLKYYRSYVNSLKLSN